MSAVRSEGEHCALMPDGKVQHWDCHTYADGTITDPTKSGSDPAYIVQGGFR